MTPPPGGRPAQETDEPPDRPGPAPRILLTGRPGCGKTTVVRRVIDGIGPGRCVGFYTEEVRQRGRRVGFDVVTLDGRRGPLARVGAPGPRVGRYGVDLASFERLAVSALEVGLRTPSLLLVIDEIGKMELFSPRFVELLEPVFDAQAPHAVVGTVMSGRHRQVDALRRSLGVRVVAVTVENRDRLPRQLIAELEALFG